MLWDCLPVALTENFALIGRLKLLGLLGFVGL